MTDEPKVKTVIKYGVANVGETVLFELLIEGGEIIKYQADYSNMGLIVAQLISAGQLAATTRRAGIGGILNDSDFVRGFSGSQPRAGVFQDGTIALSFATKEGPPLSIQLSAQDATTLLSRVQTALADLTQTGPAKPN